MTHRLTPPLGSIALVTLMATGLIATGCASAPGQKNSGDMKTAANSAQTAEADEESFGWIWDRIAVSSAAAARTDQAQATDELPDALFDESDFSDSTVVLEPMEDTSLSLDYQGELAPLFSVSAVIRTPAPYPSDVSTEKERNSDSSEPWASSAPANGISGVCRIRSLHPALIARANAPCPEFTVYIADHEGRARDAITVQPDGSFVADEADLSTSKSRNFYLGLRGKDFRLSPNLIGPIQAGQEVILTLDVLDTGVRSRKFGNVGSYLDGIVRTQ